MAKRNRNPKTDWEEEFDFEIQKYIDLEFKRQQLTPSYLKLDFFLYYIIIRDRKGERLKYDDLINDEFLNPLNVGTRRAMVDKLIKDGYLHCTTPMDVETAKFVWVSVEGFLFSSSGGYVKKAEREDSEKVRNRRIATWVMIGTVGAMLFSGISLIISWRNSNQEKTIVVQLPAKSDSITNQNNH